MLFEVFYVMFSSGRSYLFGDRIASQIGFPDNPRRFTEEKMVTLHILVNDFFRSYQNQLVNFTKGGYVIPQSRLHVIFSSISRNVDVEFLGCGKPLFLFLPRLLPHLHWRLQKWNILIGLPVDPLE